MKRPIFRRSWNTEHTIFALRKRIERSLPFFIEKTECLLVFLFSVLRHDCRLQVRRDPLFHPEFKENFNRRSLRKIVISCYHCKALFESHTGLKRKIVCKFFWTKLIRTPNFHAHIRYSFARLLRNFGRSRRKSCIS